MRVLTVVFVAALLSATGCGSEAPPAAGLGSGPDATAAHAAHAVGGSRNAPAKIATSLRS